MSSSSYSSAHHGYVVSPIQSSVDESPKPESNPSEVMIYIEIDFEGSSVQSVIGSPPPTIDLVTPPREVMIYTE